ncbi:thiol reductant ABC exporter subunit CydD [Loigolactobacillus backii]|uniref:Thiol reductant ABC exporter subunit CydD n=1 Tax=Loigolactobacillus backii TaxID=375175 RepID=A0A192GZ71_9LACO|nr:thiol reductant ABC exporter subunit CydD [Loigolactobacillus backii]ANK59050.1 thiol reductant ABC exporter subunit CydD [Loigolactobacillus backii]ANK61282.1 thiol reductant ABC exporter subunit CydD [Loigolactobacillus backii]ANK64039.1 thiol reductant ABC exporter subunit CydD [Loigolactobacillus backii]ANK66487.1 thiol reductant ABC exporter subunit CydD [Loigolactobacillus backii]ANK69518.1 thiol reductant ABC exporter subunit CydD [Loigolactobacillus backii]
MVDKQLFSLSGIKKVTIMLVGLTVLQAFMILFQGKYLALALVKTWHLRPLNLFGPLIGLFFAAFIGRHLINWVKSIVLDRFANQASQSLREQLLTKLFHIGPSLVAKQGTGNLVTMALDGIDEVDNYLTLILNKMLNMMIIPWILLIYIFTLDVKTGVVLLLVVPIVILFMIILGFAARDKADKQYAGYQLLSNHFVDALRGLSTLKLLGISKQYANNVYSVSESYRKQTMAVLRIAVLSTFALDFFTTLSIAVVAVFLGLDLLAGKMPYFPALASLILAPEFFLPLRDFSSDYHATLNGKNAMQAIRQLLALPEATQRQALTSLTTFGANDELEFKHVNVSYENNNEHDLADFSFKVHGFQKIGVMGPSGSGKSTLINTLGGFLLPEAKNGGQILLNGQQVPHLSQEQWQNNFVYMPQKPYLFHATIGQNIAFYQPKASREAIKVAAENAGLTIWLKQLPAGLDTVIGEGERGISGGQAQRIALARAFLDRKRRVLLFDEPTAHLDIETEAALKETMLPLFKDHLIFFATHRLHWMQEMDQIMVIEAGRLVEMGTPQQLQQKQGAYTQLMTQMKGAKL